MQCSLCSSFHPRICHGCTGGTDDVVIDSTGDDSFKAKQEHRLMSSLIKAHKAHHGKVAIKLFPIHISTAPLAIQYLAVALKNRYPQGIVAVHSEHGCVRFTPQSPPQHVGLTCAIELLRYRLAVGVCIICYVPFVIQIGNKKPKLYP